jgi:hypothetical protein
MSTALVYVFLLLPVIAVAWIIWSYRRKAGDKEARSREREMELVGLLQADRTPRTAAAERASANPGAPVAAPPAAVPSPAPSPAATGTRRERFLSQPETLVYYLLRTGMAGYEVFPRVSLASVIAAASNAPARSASHAPSGAHDLDFVVCDKSMRIVAAIQLAGRLQGADSARVEQNLAAAGIRLVTVDPKALPKRAELGTLILG